MSALDELFVRPGWQAAGACRGGGPDRWFPERGGPNAVAKATCQDCTVRAECLETALLADEKFGVWGGFTVRERRRLRRERGLTGTPYGGDHLDPERVAEYRHRFQVLWAEDRLTAYVKLAAEVGMKVGTVLKMVTGVTYTTAGGPLHVPTRGPAAKTRALTVVPDQDPSGKNGTRGGTVMNMSPERLYSTDEAARMSGASQRQVRYWVSTGRFAPAYTGEGTGSRHGFSASDILRLRVIFRLLAHRVGVTPDSASAAADVAVEGSGRWLVVAWSGGAVRTDEPWAVIKGGAVLVDLDTLDREVA